jgi:putative N-acetylmannosamine-6-phosphate epimerase
MHSSSLVAACDPVDDVLADGIDIIALDPRSRQQIDTSIDPTFSAIGL